MKRPIASGQLFRTCLLNCCFGNLENLECMLLAQDAAAATSTKASESQVGKAVAEQDKDKERALSPNE